MVRSDRARYLPPALLLLLAAVIAWTSFGGGEDEAPVAVAAVDGLCAARDAAAGGESEAASAVFADRAHEPLHDLAAAVAVRDRGAAGRLLQAKQEVEAALDQGELAAFDELVAAAREAGGVLGGDPGGC